MTAEIHALAGAYALDAVSETERAAFERHVRECAACEAEVAELREAASRLATGTWSAPPPRLRAAVLEQVRRTRQVRPGAGGPERESAALGRWRRRTAAAVAAAILAAGASAATYAVQQQRVREERAAAAAARAEAARVRAVLAAPDAQLRTGTVHGGGRVTVVVSERLDTAVIMLTGAAAPGPGRAYQFWAVHGTASRPAGVLAAGQTSATHSIQGVRGMDALRLTVEPAGGSAEPTLPPVAAVPMG